MERNQGENISIFNTPLLSADVGFLQMGFLKPSSSAGWGYPPPVAFGVISPSLSHIREVLIWPVFRDGGY
jgi:hypothetical protein